MCRSMIAAALATLLPCAPGMAAPAQGSATAEATVGSEQRRAILDALRPAVEARLGPDVVFVVDRIDVEKGWALVDAEPQRRGGARIDGRGIFPAETLENMDGVTVTAVLRFRERRWNLVDHRFGATDVWYCNAGPASFLKC